MSQHLKKSSFIASPPVTVPSPIDLLDILGDDSKKFVTVASLNKYGLENLPPKEAASLLSGEKADFPTISRKIKGFWDSVKVLSESEEQTVPLPVWEIHRPKVDGCTATLQRSSSAETDYSLTLKVFGIGGGVTKSISIGYKDTIEADGPCLQVTLPVKIKVQECASKNGSKFTRINVDDIGTDPSSSTLTGSSDKCGLNPSQIKETGWQTHDITIPAHTSQKKDLSVQSSQAAELDLQLSIPNVSIGPKVVLKLQKELDYSYKLVGPHRYIAYFPKNTIAWYWSVVG